MGIDRVQLHQGTCCTERARCAPSCAMSALAARHGVASSVAPCRDRTSELRAVADRLKGKLAREGAQADSAASEQAARREAARAARQQHAEFAGKAALIGRNIHATSTKLAKLAKRASERPQRAARACHQEAAEASLLVKGVPLRPTPLALRAQCACGWGGASRDEREASRRLPRRRREARPPALSPTAAHALCVCACADAHNGASPLLPSSRLPLRPRLSQLPSARRCLPTP